VVTAGRTLRRVRRRGTGLENPPDPRHAWKKHMIAEEQAGATDIMMADVNRDGKMDFVATRGHGTGVVWFEAPSWRLHEIDETMAGPIPWQ
jgi:hypothetical protein